MTSRSFFAAAAVLVCVGLHRPALALESGEYQIAGKIEAVDDQGRLRVDGRTILVDEDTEIKDPVKRTVTRAELLPEIEVEITYEMTTKGDHAKLVIANVVR